MSQIINEETIEKFRSTLKGNYSDSIKESILGMIENRNPEILDSNLFNELVLERMAYQITDDEELNNMLDSIIIDKLDEFVKANHLEEEEEL